MHAQSYLGFLVVDVLRK
uniref:Uncharacterized protein n=1 Tax=Moniliophthora roreri TaxID=221103 RepID=A0A0W0FDK6_MONRR